MTQAAWQRARDCACGWGAPLSLREPCPSPSPSEEDRAIPRDRFRQMLDDRADAAKTACVFMSDEPVSARRPALGQDAPQVFEPSGDEVVHDAQADARANGLELRDCVRAFEAGRRAG